MQQSGAAAARAAAEDASGSGKEGSSAGILKVWRCHFTLSTQIILECIETSVPNLCVHRLRGIIETRTRHVVRSLHAGWHPPCACCVLCLTLVMLQWRASPLAGAPASAASVSTGWLHSAQTAVH